MSELPQGWVLAPLASICTKIVDGSHNPPKAVDSGFPMLSARNIQNRRINFDEFRFIGKEDFVVENARTNIESGDVLLTIVGTIGRTAVVPNDEKPFSLQRSVAVLKPIAVTSKFLAYSLESPLIQKFLIDNAKGTAQKGIYLKALSQVRIPLAPLNEQKRITDKLDQLIAAVDSCKTRLDTIPGIIRRFRQSVLAAATSGELTAEWRENNKQKLSESVLLGDWCDVLGGKRLPKGFELTDIPSGYPYVRVTDFDRFSIKAAQLKYVPAEAYAEIKRYIINDSDIYISIAGTIGIVGQVPSELSGANLTENAARIVIHKGFIPRYLMFQLASPELQTQMHEKKIATTQDKLGLFRVKELEIVKPSIEEQQEVVRRVEALFTVADRLETRYLTARAQVNQLTPSLLAKAFSGELVPQNPNDEPAEKLLKRISTQFASVSKSVQKARKVKSTEQKEQIYLRRPTMPKKRHDLDVKGKQFITNKLRDLGGKASAEQLYNVSDLPLVDFYKQLSDEFDQGWLRKSGDMVEVA